MPTGGTAASRVRVVPAIWALIQKLEHGLPTLPGPPLSGPPASVMQYSYGAAGDGGGGGGVAMGGGMAAGGMGGAAGGAAGGAVALTAAVLAAGGGGCAAPMLLPQQGAKLTMGAAHLAAVAVDGAAAEPSQLELRLKGTAAALCCTLTFKQTQVILLPVSSLLSS